MSIAEARDAGCDRGELQSINAVRGPGNTWRARRQVWFPPPLLIPGGTEK